MAFDFGAGASAAGAAVSKTAGDYLTDSHRADLDMQKVQLADELAGKREDKQNQFAAGENEKQRTFASGEGILNRKSEEARTSTTAGATLGAASIQAAAHRDATNITANVERYKIDKSLEIAHVYADQRDTASQRAADAKTAVAKIVADGRRLTQNAMVPSADALETLANAYNATGELPSTGYGGAAGKTAVLDRAAQLRKDAGVSDDQWMDQKNRAKFAEPAAKNLQKQYASTEAYSATAEKNADIVKELLDKGVGPTGMPIFDAWIQSGRRLTGNDDVAKFGAALYAYATENAKVMSGAMGNAPLSDAARKEMETTISNIMNKDQLIGVMATLDAERTNRMTGFQEQMDKLNKMAKGQATQPLPHVIGATPSAPTAGKPIDIPMTSSPTGPVVDPRGLKPGVPYNDPRNPGGQPLFWDPAQQQFKASP